MSDIAEEPDGTVWLASSAGLVRIPGSARRPATATPIFTTDVLVDGARVVGTQPGRLDSGQGLEVRYAVTSFRDRRRLHIEARVGKPKPWCR